VVNEAQGNADLYSVGKLAQFLICGSVDYSAEDLEGQVSPEMQEFIRRTESENPF